MLEAQIRDEINRRVARGVRLTVQVLLHAADGEWTGRVRLNSALAKAYARELQHLAKELKISGAITLDQLVRAPWVLQTDEPVAETADYWPAVEKALHRGLDMLVKMRTPRGRTSQQRPDCANGRHRNASSVSKSKRRRWRSVTANNCESESGGRIGPAGFQR